MFRVTHEVIRKIRQEYFQYVKLFCVSFLDHNRGGTEEKCAQSVRKNTPKVLTLF
jgi:hypothetical protein